MEINIWIYYLITINVFTFAVFWIDKHNAIAKSWRVPEFFMLLLVISGGSVGALLAMRFLPHKINHKEFAFGVPFILMAQIVIAVFKFFVN